MRLKLIITLASVLLACNCYAVDLTDCADIVTGNTTYNLLNDVTADGTCFTIDADGVVLDLGGYTVTYDNAAPITVANGSFESALSGSWDVTGASNAAREAGVYLENTVYDGDYALKVTTPTSNQVIQSVGTVTLEANTQYSLSGMVYNMISDDIQISLEFEGTAISVTRAERTWRGMQYIYAQFTTGGSGATYQINLKVEGAESVGSGAVYFDDIRVQQSGHHGVHAGGLGWARRPTVTNGTITQGQAHGDFSHAIYSLNTNPIDNPGTNFHYLELNVSGNSSKAIDATYLTNGSVHDVVINSTADTTESRDAYTGALISFNQQSVDGAIYNVTINSGIQTGIKATSGVGNRIEIYDNDITLQSKYTNGFAILSYQGYGAIVYGNTINCGSGDNACAGIQNNSIGGKIYDNTIAVQVLPNNQEYTLPTSAQGGCTWAFGIQIEQAATDVEVYGNDVTANGGVCGAMAFRQFSTNSAEPAGINVHGNTFKGIQNGAGRQTAAVSFLQSYAYHLTFTGNRLITNTIWLALGGAVVATDDRSITLDGNIFELSLPKASLYAPLADEATAAGTNHARNVTLSNNQYQGATVQEDMSTAVFQSANLDYAEDTYATNIVISGNLYKPVYVDESGKPIM